MKKNSSVPLVALALLAIGSILGRALGQDKPSIQALDVYGTQALDAAEIERTARSELDALAAAIAARDATRIKEAKAAITKPLLERGDFAYLELTIIQYFPPTPGLYATIDVVETKDRARRMPFRPAPSGVRADPGGLLAAWDEYSTKLTALASRGAVARPGDCPVLHCLMSFSHEDLQPYLARFNAGVATHGRALVDIVRSDGDAHHRAVALFLLGHSNDANALMPLLGQAMFDADQGVRNNAMRVMTGMAQQGLRVDYPINDIIAALDFPATTDRNKAVAVTSIVIDKLPKYRDIVLQQAVPTLLRLLKLEQPNNREFAYLALKTLSGKDFGPRAFDQWAAWAKDVEAKRVAAPAESTPAPASSR